MNQELRALIQMTIVNVDAIIKDSRTPEEVKQKLFNTMKTLIDCRDSIIQADKYMMQHFPEFNELDNVISISNRKRMK